MENNSIKKYIDCKLNEAGMAGALATNLAISTGMQSALSQTVPGVNKLINGISDLYNSSKYKGTDCSTIASPEERISCELYNKINISNIRINQLLQLKTKCGENIGVCNELDKHIQAEQASMLKYKSQLRT